ncbi:hypothetical protein N9S66_00720, partial [bacterium]|nr:hypothetical protein [bacterium]
MCAKPAEFRAALGAKNGIGAKKYVFTIGGLWSRSGSYSNLMIRSCKTLGMAPVCDHPAYCKTDSQALYLGQSHHMAYRPHRANKSYMPAGFDKIAIKWTGLCSYTARANGNYALCNIPVHTHAWRHPGQYNPGFVCGKEDIPIFTAKLGAKNGVPTREYLFRIAALDKLQAGSYTDMMVKKCAE